MAAPKIVAVFSDWVPLPIHKKPTYAIQRVQRMIRMFMGERLLLEFPILHNSGMRERIFSVKTQNTCESSVSARLSLLLFTNTVLRGETFYKHKAFPKSDFQALSQVCCSGGAGATADERFFVLDLSTTLWGA
jgi:hypothetical protein